MRIDQIQVGFRYRKDLGGLWSLADSISEVGLLHPVVVTPEGRLIAGQRRLGACRLLGWPEVPVTVVDLYQAARGEAHDAPARAAGGGGGGGGRGALVPPRHGGERTGGRPRQDRALSRCWPHHH